MFLTIENLNFLFNSLISHNNTLITNYKASSIFSNFVNKIRIAARTPADFPFKS